MWECEWRRQKETDPALALWCHDHDLVEPLDIRKAFYGGRTGCTKLWSRVVPGGVDRLRKQNGGMPRLSDALFGLAVKGVGKMGRAGLAHAIKSDMAKGKIKNVATKYINRGIDDMTSDMSKKLKTFSKGQRHASTKKDNVG